MADGEKSGFARALLPCSFAVVAVALLLLPANVVTSRSSSFKERMSEAKQVQPVLAHALENAFVNLDADDQERGGIETAAPKEISYREQVRAFGVILSLDRLTTLFNNATVSALQLKAAEAKLAASQTADARAHDLLKDLAASQAQAESAEATHTVDTIGLETAKAGIEAVKDTAIQEWGSVLGEAVAERSALAENLVLGKSRLIQLTLQPGATADAPAHIKVILSNGYQAEADFISEAAQTDPKIANVSFFYTMPGVFGALAGTNVTAWFPKGKIEPSVVIPSSAIVWQAGRPWVYVQMSSERFQRRMLDKEAIPTEDGGYVLPVTRWPHDKSIVVAGAEALLFEETKSQIHSDDDDD